MAYTPDQTFGSAPDGVAGGSPEENVFFYHTDPMGTPVAMSDYTGRKVWEADYLPFGREYTVEATIVNNRRFINKEKDAESGYSYFGARYLDTSLGRFLTPDPVKLVDQNGKINQAILTNPQRLNMYVYGLNNPYRYVDPDGNWSVNTKQAISASWGLAKNSAAGIVSLAGMVTGGLMITAPEPITTVAGVGVTAISAYNWGSASYGITTNGAKLVGAFIDVEIDQPINMEDAIAKEYFSGDKKVSQGIRAVNFVSSLVTKSSNIVNGVDAAESIVDSVQQIKKEVKKTRD